jgi:hypothetical protein
MAISSSSIGVSKLRNIEPSKKKRNSSLKAAAAVVMAKKLA